MRHHGSLERDAEVNAAAWEAARGAAIGAARVCPVPISCAIVQTVSAAPLLYAFFPRCRAYLR